MTLKGHQPARWVICIWCWKGKTLSKGRFFVPLAYRRVSTAEQSLDRQLVDQPEINKVFEDKVTLSQRAAPGSHRYKVGTDTPTAAAASFTGVPDANSSRTTLILSSVI